MLGIKNVITYLYQIVSYLGLHDWVNLCNPEIIPETVLDEDESPLTKSRIEYSKMGPNPLPDNEVIILEDWYEI